MADNTLTIEIKDKGTPAPGAATPPSPGRGSAPGPSSTFDPVAEAQKQLENEKHRQQVADARLGLLGIMGPPKPPDPFTVKPSGEFVGPMMPDAFDPAKEFKKTQQRLQAQIDNAKKGALDITPEGMEKRAAKEQAEKAKKEHGEQLKQVQGAAGGGMAGGALELAGGIATGNPLAIVAGIQQVIDAFKEKLIGAVNVVGDFATGVAKLDIGAVGESINKVIDAVVPFGEVITAVNRQLAAFFNALDGTAKKMSQYSGTLAVSEAHAEVRQVIGDINRSNRLAPVLAPYAEARSRMSEAGQDLLTTMLKPLIPIATKYIEFATNFLRGLDVTLKAMSDLVFNSINGIIDSLNVLLSAIPFFKGRIDRLVRQAEKDESKDPPYWDEWKAIRSPGEAMRQERERIDNLRRQRDPRLNIPIVPAVP